MHANSKYYNRPALQMHTQLKIILKTKNYNLLVATKSQLQLTLNKHMNRCEKTWAEKKRKKKKKKKKKTKNDDADNNNKYAQ
jgi:hypothetical protein